MRYALLAFISAGSVLSACAEGWYVEGGAVYRKSLNLEMRSDSYARRYGLQAAREADDRPSLRTPDNPLLADDLSGASRTFSDGAVWTDASTPLFGNTENWSFSDLSQYNAEQGTLTYHVSSEQWQSTGQGLRRTVATDKSDVLRKEDEDGAAGASIRGGYVMLERETFWLSLQMGLNVYGENEASLSGTPYAQTVTTERYETTRTVQEHWSYTYDAGFDGAQLVDVRAPGTTGSPYLPVTPTGRRLDSVDDVTTTDLLSRDVAGAAAHTDLDVDLQLTQLALGPRLEWKLHRRVSAGLLAYLSANVIDFSASRDEAFAMNNGSTLAAWHDSQSKTTVAPGGGAEVSLTLHVTDRVYLTVQGGYDAIFDEPGLSVGPDEVKADLDSWTLGAHVGVRL